MHKHVDVAHPHLLALQWVPIHVTVGLFKVSDTSGATMAVQSKAMFDTFVLIQRIIVFVKDEGGNLSPMASALNSIVSCDPLQLPTIYEDTYFSDVISKAC